MSWFAFGLNFTALVFAILSLVIGFRMISNELAMIRTLLTHILKLATVTMDLEVATRAARVEAGESMGRPGEEVFRDLEAKLKRRSTS